MNTVPKKNRPRPPITREEVTLVIGGPRAFRPEIEGTVYRIAVQVTRRTDVRVELYEYVPGWVTYSKEVIATKPDVTREDLQFLPRTHLGHDDSLEYIKCLQKASTAIGVSIANRQKERESVLTHRLELK